MKDIQPSRLMKEYETVQEREVKWKGRMGMWIFSIRQDKLWHKFGCGKNIINFFIGMHEQANSLSQSVYDTFVILSVVMYVFNRSWFYFSLSDCCLLRPFNLGFLKLSDVRCSLIWVISVNSKMVGSSETNILNSNYDLYFSSHKTSIRMVTCVLL